MPRKLSGRPHADDTEYASKSEELAKCTGSVRYICTALLFGSSLSLRCLGDVPRYQNSSGAVDGSLLQMCSVRTFRSTSGKLRVQTEFLGQKASKRDLKQRRLRFTQLQAATRTLLRVSDICLRSSLTIAVRADVEISVMARINGSLVKSD